METFDARMLGRRLVGEMAIEDFNRDVRERRAAKFDAAIGPEALGELCSLSRLESALAREAVPTAYIDVFTGGQLAQLDDVQRMGGKSSLAVVAASIRRGATIRVRDIQKFDARLNRFAGEIQRLFAAQSQINVYLTPPAESGFPPHFDTTDVFILQCVGRKQWTVFHDYVDRTELPLMDTPWEPDRYKPAAPGEDMTLCPGDILYLPRGTMHQAFCTDRESLHLTIGLVPMTYADLLARELRRIAGTDVELRRRVPWSAGSGDKELGALTDRVRARWVELAGQIDVAEALRAEQRVLATDAAAPAGVLAAAIASLDANAGADR